jgi:mono/diheme cytochrome c family protein
VRRHGALLTAVITLAVAFAALMTARAAPATPSPAARPAAASKGSKAPPDPAMVEKGEHLVAIAACNDCHSPKIFGPKGPSPDPTKLLSGHPRGSPLPPVPWNEIAPDKWGAVGSNDFTAWAGPWGVSFAINLTPDVDTGIGSWTEAMFMKALRTGKHMGEGRPILPPMPVDFYSKITDDEMKAIFAYLRSVKPVSNVVPDPMPPPPPPKP